MLSHNFEPCFLTCTPPPSSPPSPQPYAKRHAAFTPTDSQFRFLVDFAFRDLESSPEAQRGVTFGLLRAILARRPLLPEVYDLMDTAGRRCTASIPSTPFFFGATA